MAADATAPKLGADDGGAVPVERNHGAANEMLGQILASEGQLTAHQSRFVRSALQLWADGGGAMDLSACFGWKPRRGERSTVRLMAKAKRQAALVAAYRAMTDCERKADWGRCEVLITELADFASNYWPRWMKSGPPAGTSELRQALYEVFAALPDEPPPMTTRGLYEALKRTGAI